MPMNDKTGVRGDALFGAASATYGQARPGYPDALYAWLESTGAVAPGMRVLEVGAGSGLATRRLLQARPSALVIVEPDAGFAAELDALAASHPVHLRWLHSRFETVELPLRSFDLAVAATSYHWLEPDNRVQRFAAVLRPGGHLALWWNVFGDPDRADAFHEATLPVLGPLAAPSDAGDGVPFGLDVRARREELTHAGWFEWVGSRVYRWTLHISTAEVGALYGTFSVLLRLPPAQRLQTQRALMAIADQQFGGQVERNMCTPVYLLRRLPDTAASHNQTG